MIKKIAYYECGGAEDLNASEEPQETCPHSGCNAALDEVTEVSIIDESE